MKKLLIVLIMGTTISSVAYAQELQPNQNANYKISQDRYTKLADSILKFEGTTVQNTYKAIDYMQDKLDRKAARRAFRQQLRLERARNPYYWSTYNSANGWYSPYYNSWNNIFPYNNYYRSSNWMY